MAITKEKKTTILAKLDGIKSEADSIVFVNFSGMAVQDSTEMRAKLRNEGVGYFVAKKTLIAKAFDGAYEGEAPQLDGEIALAYSTDAIAPAQNIKAFVGEFKDNLAIAGGIFQGVYKNKEEMTEIASIPALPVLRGMFVNVINSPIQGLVLGLSAIADKKSA
jgi:large subunit ribosomal protein L10